MVFVNLWWRLSEGGVCEIIIQTECHVTSVYPFGKIQYQWAVTGHFRCHFSPEGRGPMTFGSRDVSAQAPGYPKIRPRTFPPKKVSVPTHFRPRIFLAQNIFALGCFSLGKFRPAHLRIGTFRPRDVSAQQIFELGLFGPSKFWSMDI